jgi:hypothetical protein
MKSMFVLFFCSLIALPAQAITDKIVLVDGLTPTLTGQCGFRGCTDRPSGLWNELGALLENEMTQNGNNADIHAFLWSGDMVKHGEKLKTKFRNWFFTHVCAATEICHASFIAHSWGSVIATDFIASQQDNPYLKIRTVVTFGSPVTGATARLDNLPLLSSTPFWIKAIEKVRSTANWLNGQPARWVNVVNAQDPIGWDYLDENNRPIAGVENLRSDATPSSKGRLHNAFPINESELDPLFLPAVLQADSQGIEFLKIIIDGWRGQSGVYDMTQHVIPAYEPLRLAKYVTDRLPVVMQPVIIEPQPPESLPGIGSTFHGAGSLIEPQTDCYGCNRDIAVMQPATTASTVVFQSKNDSGRCPYLELQGDLDSVHIVTKAWSDSQARYTYTANLPVSLPVFNLWNTTAVTSMQPLTQAMRIYAYCRSYDTYGTARTRAPEVDVTFADGYTWAGNGSLISRDSVGSDFGNIKDVAITHRNKASVSAFQWQVSPRCASLKIDASAPFSGTLKVKAWDGAAYSFKQTVSFPYTLNRASGYWVIAVETAPNVVSGGKVYAACQK